MFRKLKIWLREPYAAYTTGRHNLPLIIGSGIFIFLFLSIFEPFKIYTITDPSYKLRLILGYTMVPPICVIIMIEVLGRIFPNSYRETNWTIGHEMLFVNGLILLISIGNFIISIWHQSSIITFSLSSFLKMWFYSAAASFFPAMVFIWFRFVRLNKYYSHPANIIENPTEVLHESEPVSENAILTLTAENGKDKVMLLSQQLCYIEADDNYVTIVYVKDGSIKKELLRSSLGKIESQINNSHICRCHRSYMVNLQKVYRVTGNAQGYKLHLWHIDVPLPVSRSYTKKVLQVAY